MRDSHKPRGGDVSAILHECQKASGRVEGQGLWPKSRAVRLLDVCTIGQNLWSLWTIVMTTESPKKRVGPETTIASSCFQRLALFRVWWLTPVISSIGKTGAGGLPQI